MASLATTPPARRAEADWPVPWQPVWGPDDGPAARAQAALARAALATLGRLPAPLLRAAIGGLARVARRFDRRHSDAARGFLRQALGELPDSRIEAHVLAAYRHFLRVVVDAERFQRVVPWEKTPERFEVHWSDDARRVVEARRGCVFVTAHLGNWEILVTLGPWLGLDPTYAIAKPMKNRPLSRATQESRLNEMARLTGGLAFFPSGMKELDTMYGRISSEVRAQYVLGYVSTNSTRDGAWRKVSVRVTRPGARLTVRTREGYFAGSK